MMRPTRTRINVARIAVAENIPKPTVYMILTPEGKNQQIKCFFQPNAPTQNRKKRPHNVF